MKTIGKKLKKLRNDLNLTQKEFGDRLGVGDSIISKLESGTAPPSREMMEKLMKEFGVTPEFLLLPEADQTHEPLIQYDVALRNAPGRSGYGVPYYEVDVSAGNINLFNDHHEQPTSYIWFPGFGDCDFACRVTGDSMISRIDSGDIIVCKLIRDTSILAFGDIHLVITPEQRFVKIIRRSHESGYLILRSINPNYDDIDLPMASVLHVYLVKGIIKKTQI